MGRSAKGNHEEWAGGSDRAPARQAVKEAPRRPGLRTGHGALSSGADMRAQFPSKTEFGVSLTTQSTINGWGSNTPS